MSCWEGQATEAIYCVSQRCNALHISSYHENGKSDQMKAKLVWHENVAETLPMDLQVGISTNSIGHATFFNNGLYLGAFAYD